MGKYIKFYKKDADFKPEYWSESYFEPWVSLTEEVDKPGEIVSFVCSAGTFTYDSYDDNYRAYVWVNGSVWLATPVREPKVGAFDYGSGQGAYDIENDVPITITTVNESDPTVETINRVDFNKTEYEKLLEVPFTIKARGNGTITISAN